MCFKYQSFFPLEKCVDVSNTFSWLGCFHSQDAGITQECYQVFTFNDATKVMVTQNGVDSRCLESHSSWCLTIVAQIESSI